MINHATHKDLRAIAECHVRAFPKSFMSRLGVPFVEKTIGWYLSDDKKFLLQYVKDGKCLGYCGGFIDDGTSATGSTSGMIQHAFSAAIKGFIKKPWLLFHAEMRKNYKLIFRNILRKMGLVKKKKKATGEPASPKPRRVKVGLVGIGVVPEAQGTGVGYELLMAFENIVRGKGYQTMSLTVKKNNSKAIKSYTRNGWQVSGEMGENFTMEKQLA